MPRTCRIALCLLLVMLLVVPACRARPDASVSPDQRVTTNDTAPRGYQTLVEAYINLVAGDDVSTGDRKAMRDLFDDRAPGRSVDLNGDAKPERILAAGYVFEDGEKRIARGATGNGEAWVLTRRHGTWHQIGRVGGLKCHVLNDRTNGWLDLSNSWDMGVEHIRTTYRYRDGRYRAAEKTRYNQSKARP